MVQKSKRNITMGTHIISFVLLTHDTFYRPCNDTRTKQKKNFCSLLWGQFLRLIFSEDHESVGNDDDNLISFDV